MSTIYNEKRNGPFVAFFTPREAQNVQTLSKVQRSLFSRDFPILCLLGQSKRALEKQNQTGSSPTAPHPQESLAQGSALQVVSPGDVHTRLCCYFGCIDGLNVPEQDCHIPSFAETPVQPLPRFRCFKKGATDAFPRAAPEDSACGASSFSVTALLYTGLLAVPVTIAIYKLPENLAA